MADHSHIEWTDATWNPITGCSVVSPGCTNCYAMKLAGTRLQHHPSRAGLTTMSKAGPVWNGQVRLNEQWLDQPLKWKRPRMIFVCAHGDLFHEAVPDEWIDRVFAVMALSPQHTFQVLTKRSARMRDFLTKPYRPGQFITVLDDGSTIDTPAANIRVHAAMCDLLPKAPPLALNAAAKWQDDHHPGGDGFMRCWPLPNVWLGVSAEDQTRADERIPDLLATSAAVRFVSAEPLLGPIDFNDIPWPVDRRRLPEIDDISEGRSALWPIEGTRLDWVIVGGESGQDARPMHPDWARSIRDQCAAASVPFFFKQWGNWSAVSQMSEEQIDACYPPLKERHPEATRHSLVAVHVLHTDGARHRPVDRNAFLQGTGAMTMFEVGKKRAGRLLDGVEHDGMPQPREVPAL